MLLRPLLCAFSLLSLATTVLAQQPDRPVAVVVPAAGRPASPAQSMQEFDQLIAEPVREARRTLAEAQRRYQAGLRPGETFYLTTRVQDPDGTFEQVFVLVRQWEGPYVQGTIANALEAVKTYAAGQEIEFTTSAVLDWTLVRANGAEEGNYVGKFLDIQRRLDALDR
ncbi:hypothetical protein SAMN02745146_0649 [Hymenobacter daecheongensis DSM 21074]|uniref:DUF2314 domain-containing protein n=1 Tax=Hymenobacter daecheongensis DSM 21074 TaxID=1121955 RepID=A0A1M6AIE3_9BACT|nr:DUF2314 domain-containing protein [Hymenobacter daecheongensis]SHI36187.1 hypothetical protein SAMN02745146_0649 [Hymenobacter daecheongensis DSM 21074]